MGWEDAPVVQAAPKREAWEDAPVVVPSRGPKYASGIPEALSAGYQGSLAGLADRGRLPDIVLDPHNSAWYERLAAGAAQIFHEMPEGIAGAAAGASAGAAVGGVAGTVFPVVGNVVGAGVGGVIGGGAGAMALPAAIRQALMESYSKGSVKNSADFLDRTTIVLKQAGKEGLIGAVTAGAGKAASVGAATMGLGAKATAAATLGAEGTALVVAPALLEGRALEPQDFLDAAILIGGLKSATGVAGKLRDVYAKTGKTPLEVMADAKADPTIVTDLKAGTPAQIVKPINAPEVQDAMRAGDEVRAQNALDAKLRGLGTQTKTIKDKDGNPITLEFKDSNPDGAQPWYIVEAKDANGNVIGSASPGFDVRPGRTMSDVEVQEAYRRKGVATAMYDFAEEVSGIKLSKSGVASADATAFWENRNARAAEPAPANDIPRAYQELARETAIREAIPDPSPQAAKFVESPFAKVPQLPGEPVLKTHVNYNYLNTPDEIKGAMSRLSELYESDIKSATRGEVSWEQTYAEAREMYQKETGEKAPVVALDNADYAKLSADLYARKQLLTSAAEQLMEKRAEYAKAAEQGLANDQMKLELLAQIDRVAQAQAAVRGSQAEVGRALNILKSTNRDKAYYDQLTNIVNGRFGVEKKLIGDANFNDMVKAMGDLGSPSEALKFAEKASKATTWEKIVEAWKSGLVSGAITQTANIMGNTTFLATRPLVDAVAVAIGMARRDADRMAAIEPLARITGNIHGVIDGSKAAWSVLRTGDGIGGKAEQHRKAIEGKVGEIIRVPFRTLSASDAFFRILNERGEAFTLASREAVKEGYNPATREFRERVAEIVANPTDAMIDQIETAGVRFTFNAPLGEKGKAVQALIKKTHSEWLVPFVQTPANAVKELMRMTPAAPIIGEWREAIAKGGVERDKAIAEMVMGSAVSATVFAFVLSGRISGQGDPDPKKRAAQMASGWQPYSIKIGDKWYSYQRLQPVGTLLGMAADAATVWDHATPDESDKIPKITATAFANAITNQTFLQGITNIINAISDPSRFGPRFVQNLAGSTIPGAVGQTAQMMDPYQREVDSVVDAIRARIPVLSEDLMPKRDIFGQPIEAKDRMGGISPITVTQESTDKVRQEVARLGAGASKAPDYIELPAARDPKLGRVKLTPEQKDIFAAEGGEMAHKVLTRLVNSPTWDTMPDLAQRNAINRVFEVSHQYAKVKAVPPEQIAKEAQRIAAELKIRLQSK